MPFVVFLCAETNQLRAIMNPTSTPCSKHEAQELDGCLLVDCLVAFGSNLGEPELVFAETIQRLSKIEGIDTLRHGKPIVTRPVGGPADQPDYLNAAIRFQTTLTIEALHHSLIDCETALGRKRRMRWGPRRIDLDLLLFGETVFESERLIVPHPRMSFRRFVLEPALEIAGEMQHPIADLSIAELVRHLDTKPSVILWITEVDAALDETYQQVLQQPASRHWEIVLASGVAGFEQRKSEAKLVAWGASRPTEFATLRFHGPQLDLPGDRTKIQQELVAAMEAMGV
jgi:2-amino-4-hydroxy-6-hydroxymethyldihydropteridine diphosphokinase